MYLKAIPERTCIGCNEKKQKKELIRIVKDKEGNIRDYANVNELVCLSNLENVNSIYINEGMSQKDRLIKLNEIAISQMQILTRDTVKMLEK